MTPPSPEPQQRAGWLFQGAAVATVCFIITILSLIATVFADPRAPVNIWLNEYGTWLLLGEVAAIVTFGVAAMLQDQAGNRSRDEKSDE